MLKILAGLAIVLILLSYAEDGLAAGPDPSTTNISGVITSTLTISADAQLVGDVTCVVADGPCIAFGASGLALRLNGYTVTGPAEPPAGCGSVNTPEDGVSSAGQSDIVVLGPGLIQRFRRHGVLVGQSSAATIRGVTASDNCFSGIQLNQSSDSDVEENIASRTGLGSGASPCGGTCIINSHNNRVRWNIYSGNGSIEPENNDFGFGLIGNSSGNLLDENLVGGNTNGVLIQAGATGNALRRNTIIGNPPAQVSVAFGAAIGADIVNLAPAGANTFEDNICLTYSGPQPAPCPNVKLG